MKVIYATTKAALAATIYFFCTPSAFSATDNGTLTVGKLTISSPPLVAPYYAAGFTAGAYGSYSPTGLTGGKTLTKATDENYSVVPPQTSVVTIIGFSFNPGHLWLTSVTCNGVTKQASAAIFSYSSGSATWSWGTPFGFYSLATGTNVSCAIAHN